jgi:hypothetical protein
MIRRLLSPLGAVIVGTISITVLTAAWLRSTAGEIAGKQFDSDRAKKTEINPVHW